ncbi:unnamed protein product, partial [Mesorhabditis belari]|uniref:Cysteine-rich motor neuron 1 protein n=1 Tax=Mesorhabditis belari TaxID=2138241 RepID=A0AAF3J7A9_9BILA
MSTTSPLQRASTSLSLNFSIFSFAFLFFLITVNANEDCPRPCPPCRSTGNCMETTLDQCGCCRHCVSRDGEDCGPGKGVCTKGYYCAFKTELNDEGKCTEMAPSSGCDHSTCSPAIHPECPADSRLSITPINGECCEKSGKCLCDLKRCLSSVPVCEEDLDRVLVENGREEPGRCCDRFECRKKEKHCASVRCPRLLVDIAGNEIFDEECPVDSLRPPTHITPGSCCPITPECKCRASVCRPAKCEEGERVKVLRKGNGSPGRCCDVWECEKADLMGKNCTWGDREYSDGQEWHSSQCEVCKCKKGVAQCSKMTCPKPPSKCTWVGVPVGECCPICLGCQSESGGILEKKKMKDEWNKDDCTTCTCSEEGENQCVRAMCSVQCENPRKVEGQCCPVCDEPTILSLPSTCPSLEHCPLRCANGLKRNDNGCFECECLPSIESQPTECTELSKENCEKQCAHGYVKDSSGCAQCRCAKCPPLHQCLKHCLYGFETNAAGCPVCKCRARIDAKLTMSDRLVSLSGRDRCGGFSNNGKLVERDGGEWWNDGCRHCFCEHKREYCSLISCPERSSDCPTERWIQKEGECCPSCSGNPTLISQSIATKHEHTVCQSPGSGRLFTDGETWQLTACVWCTCRVGYVLCRASSCPAVACPQPIADPENPCCSKCPTEPLMTDSSIVCTDESGSAHASGETWKTDDCTSCSCTQTGTIECFRESCGENVEKCKGKLLTVKGNCCALCSDALQSGSVCQYGNAVYGLREEWKDGVCRNCTCVQGGQTVCREAICPPCSDPVPIEGQCCPLCKDGLLREWSTGDHLSAFPPLSGIDSDLSSSSNSSPILAIVLGLSICSILLLVVLFIVCILKKRREDAKQPKLQSKVQLSSCRNHGSLPHLADSFEKRRRDTDTDGQSESLLSTTSESSAGMSQTSTHSEAHLLYKPNYRV